MLARLFCFLLPAFLLLLPSPSSAQPASPSPSLESVAAEIGRHSCCNPETVALWNGYLSKSRSSPETLRDLFAASGKEFGVPPRLLEAIAQVETNWTHIGPSIDQGWGLMHLVENPYCNTLGEAAALLGVDRQILKDDARANVRGAAALLAEYAGKGRESFTQIEDWFDAAARFSGLATEELRTMQAETYFSVLRNGVTAKRIFGDDVRIEADPSITVPENQTKALAEKSTDYPPALTNLAPSCNFTSGRNHAVDTLVNHWVGVGTYAGAISWFLNCESSVSAHFVIRASDGQVTQCVRIGNTAYHTGAVSFPFNNSRSLGVEHEVTVTNPSQWNSAPLLATSTALADYFCDLYGVSRTRSLPGIRGHSEMPGTSTSCPGSLPWTTWMNLLASGGIQDCNLDVGDSVRVRVIDGTPLNVRSCAGLGCSETGSKPEGSTGVIQSGPTDADGYRWWRIRWDSDNLLGWSAQGEGSVCWLESFAPPPTSTPTRTHTLTRTLTRTPTPTSTRTETRTPTETPVPTDTPTPSFSSTATETITQIQTETTTETLTPTPSETATGTPSPTEAATSTPSETGSETPTETEVPTSTSSPTATETATSSPTPSESSTSSETPTNTATETLFATATETTDPTPTNTEDGLAPHPADTNGDFRISIGEAATQLQCWREGNVSCPIGSTAEALSLWRGGECYVPVGNGYQNISCPEKKSEFGSLGLFEKGTDPSALRILPVCYVAGMPFAVTVALSFPEGPPGVVLLEDEPPAGWSVGLISSAGTFSGGKVRWSFVDGLGNYPPPEFVAYTVTPPEEETSDAVFIGTLATPNESTVAGQSNLSNVCPPLSEAIRTLPSCYSPSETLVASIDLVFSDPVPSVVLLEDEVPVGWTVTALSHQGVFSQGKARWSFVQGLGIYPPPSSVTYQVVPASGGTVFFSGTLAVPGERPVQGSNSLSECEPTFTPTEGISTATETPTATEEVPTETRTSSITVTESETVTGTPTPSETSGLTLTPTATPTEEGVTETPTATVEIVTSTPTPDPDVNGDGFVDALDLLLLMEAWHQGVGTE